jgi:hypothetical protein
MSQLVKFLILSNGFVAMLRSFSWPTFTAVVISKDLTVWLDGAKSNPNYQISKYISLTYLKFDELGP